MKMNLLGLGVRAARAPPKTSLPKSLINHAWKREDILGYWLAL